MASNVINLRTARKRRDLAEKADKAAENRARHGRTKAEKARDTDTATRAERSHDGHRLGDGEDG